VRVAVLGGTRFVGRAIVEELVAAGDDVLVVHRGETEPADLPPVGHAHAERARFADVAADVAAFAPDVVVDCVAYTAADCDAVLPHLADGLRLVVLSSMDTYRAFGAVLTDEETDPVPVTEESPVREHRYPYRDHPRHRMPDYDKLDVEPRYLDRGATVLRLPMVYGERDPQLREEFVLRRVRAGRPRIPVGAGNWLWTRGHVRDVARAVRASALTDAARGEIVNLGEPTTASFVMWTRQILAAAGSDAELVRVPDAALPDDLRFLAARPQHLLVDCSKATRLLGWHHSDVRAAVAASVRWHLDNPPDDADDDFSADDVALEAAMS
jgi:nucleoside-diphosphate-sugar epimerase